MEFSGDSQHEDASDAPSSRLSFPTCRGLLRLSRFEPGKTSSNRAVHHSTYVNGLDYCGMTDNDIRGFLDGGFIWGWNQATQIHVRLGRNGRFRNPRYGEIELLRVLQRWEGIALPPDFELHACRLTLRVEEGPTEPLRLLVYAVVRDWSPGSGGVNGNNVSVPKPGEVWWGEAAHGKTPWGLPGVGFASDYHPEADTGTQALAEAMWKPGEDEIVFESEAFARYAAVRIRDGKPLLLLLKLTDGQEDTPGLFFNLFSGEHGDSRNTVWRPRLELEWSCPTEVDSVAHDVFMEYGRVCEMPRQRSERGPWAATFTTAPEHSPLAIQVREGTGDETGPWRRAVFPFEPEREWFQLRLLAMPDPIELGDDFEAELADTWVLTGPLEQQRVPWHFLSPSGAVHTVAAEYVGQCRWHVRFTPDEVGTWRYYWTQDFLPEPYRSATGRFCVWGGSLDAVMMHLAQVEEAAIGGSRDDRRRLRPRLYALEREGMRLLVPHDYRGATGEQFRTAIRGVRSGLWGKPVPNPIPMESHRLVREVDGVELREPILDASRYGPHRENARQKRHRKRSPLRRLRRLASHLLGPRGGSPS
jgi:hypothetical protein